MKIIKKIGIMFMSLCLCIPCFSLVAHAEDGRISFTDPQTAVGEMVTGGLRGPFHIGQCGGCGDQPDLRQCVSAF